ncbi:SgcJ/EcaC family oxidoreductase [Spirosoma linguale]|uniref:DUF4440 domain-containing protein n=1 Tax=Spirosoma linguale (strain ATCC 33905 / DSM 74 / LMG 10896 / Claus 1) TaxID=504472 RepID=D2QU21_SPILD|nr:conserved hypothetical protein [Spirosoma linguale DSM 74]
MRNSITLVFLSLLSSTAFGQKSARATDSTAILAATEALVTSWNNHNYADMATYATPDVDWVNIVGMWWKGRDAVQKAHQVYHQSMFKNTPLTTVNTTIRFITPDVALVHHLTSIGAFTTPGGHTAGNDQNLATLVFVKQQGKWLLTAGQNVPVDAQAARHDPVNTSTSR